MNGIGSSGSRVLGSSGDRAAEEPRSRSFDLWLLAILAFYVAVSVAYVFLFPRVMDEFATASSALDAVQQVPYRDYCPPKTVLGYYELAPLLLLIDDSWTAVTAVKLELVLLVAVALFITGRILRRFAGERAVLASLALLVVMSTFLERSMELRTDMPCALLGLASLLLLMTRRTLLAGVVCGLTFLTTQKGIYFVAAAEVALASIWIRDRTWPAFREWLLLNAGGAATAAAYIALWSIVASPAAIVRCFYNPVAVANAVVSIYRIRAHYWTQTLVRNPFFYALAAAALLYFILPWLQRRVEHPLSVVLPYAWVMTAAAIWHKQPWPYFFVNLVSTLFVLNTFLISELIARARRDMLRAFAVTAIALGIAFPLLRLRITLRRDASMQKAMVTTAQRLLGPGEKYADGMGMLIHHEQPAQQFFWIDKPMIDYLWTLKRPELDWIAGQVDRGPTKLLIWNYRLEGLPIPLYEALQQRFAPLYGNIFYYAPVVQAPRFSLGFNGTYLVDSPAPIVIDGNKVNPRAQLALRRGEHSLSGGPARLRLLPESGIEADPRFMAPQDLFPAIYDF